MNNVLLRFGFAVLFSSYILAQGTPTPPLTPVPSKIRITLPEGISTDNVWLAYGLYIPGRKNSYIGMDGPVSRIRHFPVPPRSGQGRLVTTEKGRPYYEIDGILDGKRVERFQALVWAPGCKLAYFDVPGVSGNVGEQYTCTGVKEITLTGRIKGVDLAASPKTVWVSFNAGISGCFQLHTCDHGCAISCPGTIILDIADGAISADGTFS
jgi:hypothetical protein